ncbi:unnamed protein product [Microthlaspi erraticum]|uniref:Arabidopsis retrotransposon Orf1 C-terminal domain-containing protein n=1 Tax=Microthlaspi erraticum TaxID=1685480 RepID=A0A6D2KR53_9BRAS|nr:unnamed protein product [Microthlaspi erraticum]
MREDRADLDQGLGWITFLAKGEKRMVTFRQLGILFGFNYGEGTKWNFKEKELQRVWATIADGVYSSSRSKAAQIRSPVLICAQGTCQHLLCKEGDRDNQRGGTQLLPTRSQPTTLGINEEGAKCWRAHHTYLVCCWRVGWEFQFKFTHPLAGPSKLLLPNPELTTVVRGENIDFRPPVYTLVGHEDDLREEEPELDRAESS